VDEALKRRIENRLKEFAVALDISIAGLEWGPSDFEMGSGSGIQLTGPTQYPLAVIVGANRKVIKFTEDELEDCNPSHSQGNTVWQRLEHRLKEFLKEFAPREKQNGF
jgi:hypothetical protein